MSQLLNYSVNNKGVCRTALATQGVLDMMFKHMYYSYLH